MPLMGVAQEFRARVTGASQRHVRLAGRLEEVAVCLAIGMSEADIAQAQSRSRHTIHHQVQRLIDTVCAAKARSTPSAAAWAWLHSDCCLSSAWRVVLQSSLAADRLNGLADAHAELPERQRNVLALEAFGLTEEEVSAAMLISRGTVRSLASTARRAVVPPELPPTRQNASAWWHLHVCVLHRHPGQRSRFREIWRNRLLA